MTYYASYTANGETHRGFAFTNKREAVGDIRDLCRLYLAAGCVGTVSVTDERGNEVYTGTVR